MPHGSKLHIPPTNLLLLAAKQEPCKKGYFFRKIIPCHICCSVTPGNNFDLVILLTQVLGPSLTLVFLSGTGTHTDAHRDTHRHTETLAHALTHAQTDNN